ncbi:MAG: GyrI-like domain-containing protein [Candidatus Cloacimonetes bacterium]|nr:GyrI-like domain-containing protein [Candidatus Cloacimonadota bacterium]
MKVEWRKIEKTLYLPKTKPAIIDIPELKYFMIDGNGNPNDDFFGEYIAVLYSLAYGIRMSPKSGNAPVGYYEYTVYPLEGIWDISESAKQNYSGKLDKNSLVFTLMIRQPDFVTAEFARYIIDKIKVKKPHDLLDKVRFSTLQEGKCVQMMHLGSYDSEPDSFKKMDEFCLDNNLKRVSGSHKEIYLTDARKVASDKLKTVLRYMVEELNI